MLRIEVAASIPLQEPDTQDGLITWISVDVYEHDEDDKELIGSATAALIHAGEALALGEDLLDALCEDSDELASLYDIYFEDGWLKDELGAAGGSNVLYIAELDISPAYDGRNIELAVVRRLLDSVGQGCALAVLPYESHAEIDHWARMGFVSSTPGETEGWMHLSSTPRRMRVLDPAGSGSFMFLPSPTAMPGGKRHH